MRAWRGVLMFDNPRPFSDYVRGVNSAFVDAVGDIKPAALARDFPCALCAGAGALIKYSSYSRLSKPDDLLLGSRGAITTKEVVMCCACIGLGVDQGKVVEAMQQEAALQEHLGAMA